MEADRSTAVATLLREAEGAHALYEAVVLDGVYDQDWPRWYATYAVEHGVAEVLGQDVTVDELTTLLSDSYADFASAETKPAEPWDEYTANRIVSEL
ncbi:MAG: hypothetical protein ACXWWU_09175 [Candidatus Limnocylindria bacterium]